MEFAIVFGMNRGQRSRAAHLEPEVRRIDLTGAVLQLLYWGHANPMEFPWLPSLAKNRWAAACRLLEQLGAIQSGRITDLGRRLARLPLHPALGRMVVDGFMRGHLRSISLAAAMLSERDPFQPLDTKGRNSNSTGHRLHTAQSRRWPSDVTVRVELLEKFHR